MTEDSTVGRQAPEPAEETTKEAAAPLGPRELEVISEETEIIDPDVLLAEIDQRFYRTLHSFQMEYNRGTDQTMSPAQIQAISSADPDLRASLIRNFDKTVDATIETQRSTADLRKKDQSDGVRLLWGGLALAARGELGLIVLAFFARKDNSEVALAALIPVIGTVAGGLFVMLRRSQGGSSGGPPEPDTPAPPKNP